MPQSQDVPSPFPTSGVDVACEFARQPAGTSASAENVRSYDTIASRLRGGSRPGLAKWVDETVNGAHLVQHLAVLVDPTTLALSASLIPYTVDGTETGPDGKLYRLGGSGSQPAVSLLAGSISLQANPDAGTPPGAPVQAEAQGFSDSTGDDCEFVFTSAATVGNVAVFFVAQYSGAGEPGDALVTNGNGVALAQAGDTRTFVKAGTATGKLSCYYRTIAEVADRTCAVTLRQPGETCVVAGLEYAGVVTTGPLGSAGGTDDGDAAVMTAGSISPSNANEVIVAAFMAVLSPDTVTPAAGFTLRVSHDDGGIDSTDIQLYVIDRADSDFPNSYEPTAEFAGGTDKYCAVVASFKD